MTASVVSVHSSPIHSFSKDPVPEIKLVECIGVDGDAHSGTTVKHRSRVAKDPSAPNLRQVHLVHRELFGQLADDRFCVRAGELGENITTVGIDLLSLPVGTRLDIGAARIVITGLRNPCRQVDGLQPGLMKRVVFKNGDGQAHKLTGVMGIVARSGSVRPGDEISIELPPPPHHALTTV